MAHANMCDHMKKWQHFPTVITDSNITSHVNSFYSKFKSHYRNYFNLKNIVMVPINYWILETFHALLQTILMF